MEIGFALIPFLIITSLHIFAFPTTTSWHGQIFVAVDSLDFSWEKNEISVELELLNGKIFSGMCACSLLCSSWRDRMRVLCGHLGHEGREILASGDKRDSSDEALCGSYEYKIPVFKLGQHVRTAMPCATPIRQLNQRRSGTRFTDEFPIIVQIPWKLLFALTHAQLVRNDHYSFNTKFCPWHDSWWPWRE